MSAPDKERNSTSRVVHFEPPHPGLVATACFSLWIALLSLPMLGGAFLATPLNDQYDSGYAYREWAAQSWKELGHLPLWNPELFGGLPFVAGMHGDVLYPTAFLRLLLPVHVGMNLGFVIHYVLAGVFTYWLLRRWSVSWTGAVVGGLAYQLSGVIGSYPSPGHDGKLFVTAMLPLALVALTLAIRDRRWEGYAILALAVGLMMLSPHPQMAQYALLAAGIFTLYLVFGRGERAPPRERLVALGLALAAVIVGVGISAVQYLPFYAYIPYSPRAEPLAQDFAWSAGYAIPWEHVPEFVIARFTGETFNRSYWGPNGLKLHSEYLGLAVVALAALGALDRARRRMILWLAGIGVLFLLVGLGSETPFYRLWWETVPFARSMRAPGMALFVVALVVAILAAFGTDRLLREPGSRFRTVALVAGGVVAALGAAGFFGAMAESLAQGELGQPGLTEVARAGAGAVRLGAVAAGLALLVVGAVTLGRARGAIPQGVASLAIIAVIGSDLWLNARPFWRYSRAHEELFADDALKRHLRGLARPFRVWDVSIADPERPVPSVYPGAALMADDIAQLYGHQANELHSFDALHGRIGLSLSFGRAGHPQLLDLYAINHLIVHSAAAPESIPGFHHVLSEVPTSSGASATLFERDDVIPYARLVPAGVRVPFDDAVATVLDQRFPTRRVVLLDSTPGVEPAPLTDSLPDPVDAAITFDHWVPGHMRLTIDGGAPVAGYVLVSENHYPDWQATVDGRPAPVARGDASLITVPVDAGARQIELRFVSAEFRLGRVISLASLALVVAGGVGSWWRRRITTARRPA